MLPAHIFSQDWILNQIDSTISVVNFRRCPIKNQNTKVGLVKPPEMQKSSILEEFNYWFRNRESFELEEIIKGCIVQLLPYNEQGHLQVDHLAQISIQPDLECFQGQDIHHIPGHNCSSSSVPL